MNRNISVNKVNHCVLAVIFCVFLMTNCSYDQKLKIDQLDTLTVGPSKILNVDSVSINQLVYPQVLEFDQSKYITSINVVDNSLKVYDFVSGNVYKTYKFSNDGPNGVGRVLSVGFLNQDTICYLDQSSTLFLLDDSMKILSKHPFKLAEQKGLPLFYANHVPFLKKEKDKLIAVNYYITRVGRMMNVELDLSTNDLRYFNQVPPEIIEGYYGVDDFSYWNFVYNPNQNIYVYNFPSSDSLFVYDSNFKLLNKVNAISSTKTFSKETPLPIVQSENLDELRSFDKSEIQFRIKNSFAYNDLIYNETKNVYYRFVGLPISKMDIEDNDPIRSEVRQYTLMILDANFKLIKEYILPYNKYLVKRDCFFLVEGELYLQQNNDDEDRIYLDQINVEINEKD